MTILITTKKRAMINIKEHRIGNLVMGIWEDYDSGEELKGLCRITSLCECGSLGEGDWSVMVESLHSEERELYDEFEPIPLSEEWLLKFGFQKEDEGSVSVQFHYGVNPVTKDYLISLIWIKDYKSNKNDLEGFPFYKNGHFTIKTIHQLQNLVFALGEELTVNN